MKEEISKSINRFLNQGISLYPTDKEFTVDDTSAKMLGYFWIRRKDIETEDKDGEDILIKSFSIGCADMQKLFGRTYGESVEQLEQYGLIGRSGYSNDGEKNSTGRSFNRSYWLTKKFWDIVANRVTGYKTKIVRMNVRINEPKTLNPDYELISTSSNSSTNFNPFLKIKICDIINDLAFSDSIIDVLDRLEGITTNNLIKAQGSLTGLINKQWWYSISEEGRLYNNITLLPTQFRECLLLDDKPLIEIDIKACQLSILGMMYDRWIIPTHTHTQDAIREEKAAYNEMLLTRHIYTEVFSHGDKSRDEIKTMVSKFLNGGTLKVDLYEKLGKHFPHLANFIEAQSQMDYTPDYDHMLRFHKTGDVMDFVDAKPLDKRVGSQIMETEAKIMIEGILGTYIHDFKFITIHDAVLCHAENVDTISNAITHEFRKHTGITPRLTLTP